MIGRLRFLPFVMIAAIAAFLGSPLNARAQTATPKKSGTATTSDNTSASQVVPPDEPKPVRPVIDLRPRPPIAPLPGPVIDDNRPHVAVDDDLARLFHEAESLAEQREFKLAAVRYQRLLDAPRTTLTELPPLGAASRRWSTWGTRAEQSLIRSTELLRSAYRLVAEGEAQEALASLDADGASLGADGASLDADGPEARYARLSDTSQRFLLTTAGLNATWSLSGLALDRFDFVVAARLLERFLAAAPTVDSRRSAALLRLAVANAFLGDHAAAGAVLDAEQRLVDARLPRRPATDEAANAHSSNSVGKNTVSEPAEPDRSTIRGFVRRVLESPGLSSVDQQLASTPPWLMDTLATNAAPEIVTHSWNVDFDRLQLARLAGRPTSGDAEPARRIAAALRLLDPRSLDSGYDDVLPRLDAASVSRRWSQHPVFSSAPFMPRQGSWIGTWVDRTTILTSRQSFGASTPGTLSSALDYAFPAAWKALPGARVSMRPEFAHWEAADLPVFRDPLHGALAADGRFVFVIEPDRSDAAPAAIRNAARATSLRARPNLLVAYDWSTGEEQWRTEVARDEATAPVVDEGVIGVPVAHESRVFLPRVERGVVVVHSLSAETGEPAWSTKLCAEPRAGCWPWSGVSMTLDADDLYVATGAGAVFALSATTGDIRWGGEYPRTAERRRDLTRSSGGNGGAAGSTASTQVFDAQLDGWDEDRTLVAGRWLIVTASDSAVLRVLDRRDGRTMWTTPRRLPDGRAAAYLAGVNSRHVLVGGATFFRAYELASGKLAWTAELPEISGRALLTRDAILVPRIVNSPGQPHANLTLLNPATGAQLGDVPVSVKLPRAPVTLAVSSERVGWREPHRLVELRLRGDDAQAANDAQAASDIAAVRATRATRVAPDASPVKDDAIAPNGAANDAWRPTPISGRILVSDVSAGKVIELTWDGQIVWQRDGFALPGPICGFPNGRRFVYSHGDEALLEFDHAGQVRSRFVDLPGRPASVTSMSDGRLLLTFPDAGLLGVFEPELRSLETCRCSGRPVDARRDADGTTLLTLLADQRVIRLATEAWPFTRAPKSAADAVTHGAATPDAATHGPAAHGIVTSTIQGGLELSYPRSAQRRADGSILVTLPRDGQVLQLPPFENAASSPSLNSPGGTGAAARVIRAGLRGLQAAIELPNGRLLVADQNGLTVWEAERVVWKQAEILVGGVSAW